MADRLGAIDPILAWVDFLHRYRRSWRCWLIGGPALLDDLSVVGTERLSAARVEVTATSPERRPVTAHAYLFAGPDGVPDLPALRRALDGGMCRQVAGASADGLEAPLRDSGVLDEEQRRGLGRSLRAVRQRLPARALCATVAHSWRGRVAHVARVTLRGPRLREHFRAVGAADRHDARLHRMGQDAVTAVVGWLLGAWWAIAFGCAGIQVATYGGPAGLLLTIAFGVGALLAFGTSRLAVLGVLSEPVLRMAPRYLRRSLRTPPMPTIAVVGPDARRSGLGYALFAHLAAYARLADPARGGTLLDDEQVALAGLPAEDGPAPEWSSTYRMEFGEGIPGPRRARFVHVVLPPDGQVDPLCGRVLADANRVWTVLQGEMAPGAAGVHLTEVLARAPAERVTVLWDGPEAPAPLPATGAVRAIPLAALRDRYLAGQVTPAEAGHVVGGLLGGGGESLAFAGVVEPQSTVRGPGTRRIREGGGRAPNG